MKKITGILVLICLALTVTGCPEPKVDSGPSPDSSRRTEKSGNFTVPVDGTAGERVKKLWETTVPAFRADVQGNLGDKEYQDKRTPIFSAWVMLQGKLSLEAPKDGKAQRLIPEVLKFIDNLYGFPGYTPEKREKDREIAKKYFNERLQKLEAAISQLQ